MRKWFRKKKHEQEEQERNEQEQECPICLTGFDTFVVLNPCLHKICEVCIEELYNRNIRCCPLCRSVFSTRDQVDRQPRRIRISFRSIISNRLNIRSTRRTPSISLHELNLLRRHDHSRHLSASRNMQILLDSNSEVYIINCVTAIIYATTIGNLTSDLEHSEHNRILHPNRHFFE